MRKIIIVVVSLISLWGCSDEKIDPDKYTMPGILVASRISEGVLLEWYFSYLDAFGLEDMNVTNIYLPGAVPAERIEIFHSIDDTLHFSRIVDAGVGRQFLYEIHESGRDHFFRLKVSAKRARPAETPPLHIQFRENPEFMQLIELPYDYLLQLGNFSKDGSMILYSRNYRWDQENNCCEDYSAITYDLLQRQEILLFPQAYFPVWSPSGDQIAFHSGFSEDVYLPGNSHIGLFDPESDSIIQLTTGNHRYELPVWHPDGQSIIFLSYNEAASLYDVVSMKLATGDTRLLSTNPDFKVNYERLSFSPDGNLLAYSGLGSSYHQNLYALNILNNDISPILESIWTEGHPSFSPNGAYLAFLSNRSGRDEIWIMDLETEQLHQLTGDKDDYLYGDLVWSPDSQYLYFKLYGDDQFGIFYTRVDL